MGGGGGGGEVDWGISPGGGGYSHIKVMGMLVGFF